MNLIKAFQLSLYLMLAVSCIALGMAGEFFLPEMPHITIVCLLVLAVAYRLEDRFSLSLYHANILGGVLGAILVVWIGFQFLRVNANLFEQLPFPASLLPYLGPVLMILIPAKMLRPKHVGDYWTMYGMSLFTMSLACTMASDLSFGLLLLGWLILFVWSLTLFFLCREIVWPLNRPPERLESRWLLLGVSTRWVLFFGSISMLVFLITPRPAESRWSLALTARTHAEVGLNADSTIDLNRTGSLKMISEREFEVEAANYDGSPKEDLSPNQRWRASTLTNYLDGKWTANGLVAGGSILVSTRAAPPEEETSLRKALPKWNDKQYYITFRPNQRPGSAAHVILADPIYWIPGSPSPIVTVMDKDKSYINFNHQIDGVFSREKSLQPYVQAVKSVLQPDIGQTFNFTYPESSQLFKVPASVSASLRPWTIDLIEDLIKKKKLPGIERLEMESAHPDRIVSRQHEAVARALTLYFSNSNEYAYSLDHVRQDKRVDPIVDFLINVKSGHCERFASGLVCMLRCVGIPSQMVLGYMGCEMTSPGHYEIRADMTHAWAEVLIRHPQRIPEGAKSGLRNPWENRHEELEGHWLTLDPSPSTDSERNSQVKPSWIEGFWDKTERFFRDFILGNNNDLRKGVSNGILARLKNLSKSIEAGGWVYLVGGGSCILAGVWLRQRRMLKRIESMPIDPIQNLPGIGFHARLVEILRLHGFESPPGHTPREFAAQVAALLERNLGELALVPVEAAEIFYRARFGLERITDEEANAFEQKLNAFEERLKGERGA